MLEFSDLYSGLGPVGVVTADVHGNFRLHDKKNPTSVSTDEVLGRPNNWRSLDSRDQNFANAMPKLNANYPY